MKRVIILSALLMLSAAAQAEWIQVQSHSRGTAYLWYPVEQYFPYAYPVTAQLHNQALPIVGWNHRVRSVRVHSTVDCRDGRLKLRRATAYSGRQLNGWRVRVGSLTLTNGLQVVPGRWYAYGQIPRSGRKVIRLVCGY